jgi:sugar phosphate isomerase/epimerase
MNLVVSSIGWENFFDEIILEKIDSKFGVELVFSKIDLWDNLTDEKINEFKEKISKYNIKMESAQSLFFGVDCDSFSNERFLLHFEKLIYLSQKLGIKILVLGSPKLRKEFDIIHLNKIFKVLDSMLEGTDIKICIEPNSKQYGGKYFFTISEIVEFIKNCGFKNIGTMIDTHNSWLEGNNPTNEYNEYNEFIWHIHLSNYGLNNINNEFYNKIGEFLKNIKDYNKLLTFEILNLSEKDIDYITTF